MWILLLAIVMISSVARLESMSVIRRFGWGPQQDEQRNPCEDKKIVEMLTMDAARYAWNQKQQKPFDVERRLFRSPVLYSSSVLMREAGIELTNSMAHRALRKLMFEMAAVFFERSSAIAKKRRPSGGDYEKNIVQGHRIAAIIGSYLNDCCDIVVTWDELQQTIQVPVSVPGTGLYRHDVRYAIAHAFGIPHYLIHGIITTRYGKILSELPEREDLLQTTDQPLVFIEKEKSSSSLWRPDPNELTDAQVVLQERTTQDVAFTSNGCDAICVGFCSYQGYCYLDGRADPIRFCWKNSAHMTLTERVTQALHSYEILPDVIKKVRFVCRECSLPFHPSWRMGNVFPYKNIEMLAPFVDGFCGCYRHKRSWPRSVVAVWGDKK